MVKDRRRTEQTILDAVTRLVEEGGIGSLGVNAVAEKAGVAKMLLYRYFGSFQGLLEEWALRHSYWSEETRNLKELLDITDRTPRKERPNVSALLKSLLGGLVRSLRMDKVKREVLRWFIAERNEVTAKVMERLEDRGIEISRLFRARIDTREDVEAMVAVLVGGIQYLALIADRTDSFNGVPLNSEKGWERIETAVGRMIDRIVTGGER